MASFKTDDSFLEKISIGAIGTQKVFEHLKVQGHVPIELERGSMSYKIWKKIKIKRIRVPDILLVNCGVRVESRAKTNLEITISHSASDPERGWDFGLKDNDFVALVGCEKAGEKPIDWQADEFVQYISVSDLKHTFEKEQVDYVKPKGAEEGFEARITWPSAKASSNGIVKYIDENKIQFKRESDERTISLRLIKKGIAIKPIVEVNDRIEKNQIIASVVPVYSSIETSNVDYDFYITNLTSSSLSERYAASKALSYFDNKAVHTALLSKLEDTDEHIYVKLEAAASLARFGYKEGYEFIKLCLNDEYATNILESVIILAEIKTQESCKILGSVLTNSNLDPEIRAGAAWALGEQNDIDSLNLLISCFNSVDTILKVEAARSLAKFTKNHTGEILSKFDSVNEPERQGLAWALSKSETLKIDNLTGFLNGIDSRHWISYILGYQDKERFIDDIEKLKEIDSEVYFATTLLWKIMSSWVHELKEYG